MTAADIETISLAAGKIPMACAALGDALGAGVEFSANLLRALNSDEDGLGRRFFPYSPFGFAAGELTDDTQMAWAALSATGKSPPDVLSEAGEIEFLRSVGDAYRTWFNSDPPDVGGATAGALGWTGPSGGWESWGGSRSAGNGSLMRQTWPYAAGFRGESLLKASALDSTLTHPNPICVAACVWYSAALEGLATGDKPAKDAMTAALECMREAPVRLWLAPSGSTSLRSWNQFLDTYESGVELVSETVQSALAGHYVPCRLDNQTNWPTGYVISSLGQAVWAAAEGTSSNEIVRLAVRHGGHDTDSIAAIAGGLGGARFTSDGLTGWSSDILWLLRFGHQWPGLPCDRPFIKLLMNA